MEITVTKYAGPFEMSGNCWDTQKEALKGKHSQLTDADLDFESGKENELLERIEASLNKDCETGYRYIVYHCG
jgi:hypothetical protein